MIKKLDVFGGAPSYWEITIFFLKNLCLLVYQPSFIRYPKNHGPTVTTTHGHRVAVRVEAAVASIPVRVVGFMAPQAAPGKCTKLRWCTWKNTTCLLMIDLHVLFFTSICFINYSFSTQCLFVFSWTNHEINIINYQPFVFTQVCDLLMIYIHVCNHFVIVIHMCDDVLM